MTSARTLLEELQISRPEEIDLEAIAAHCGATVVYEPLSGCEARIVGHKDRAIIAVQAGARIERQRFSIGHELGHWQCDRHRVVFACTETAFQVEWNADNPERRANRFAADLLLPGRLFKPAAKDLVATFASVRQLSTRFVTSLTATAIRFVELGSFPAMLVCSSASRDRRWYVSGPDVRVRPTLRFGRDTSAYALAHGGTPKGPEEVCSDGWIDHPEAGRYSIMEDSIPVGEGLILSFLWWRNESQLIALDEDDAT